MQPTMQRRGQAFLLIISLVAASSAKSQLVTAYPIPTATANPWNIAAAPDGAVWFTELDGNKVGRLTKAGALTEFPLGDDFSKPYGIVVTPENEVWFGSISRAWVKRIDTAGTIATLFLSHNTRGLCLGPANDLYATMPPDRIARITQSGDVTEFALPFPSSPSSCAADPSGVIWYTAVNTNAIGRLLPSGFAVEQRFPTAESRYPDSIVLGADGNMWFTEMMVNRIGRITPAGVISEFTTTGVPHTITVGPDHNLWFVQADNTFSAANDAALVRLTYFGEMTQYPTTGSPYGAAATEHAIWFTILDPINEIRRFASPPRRRAVGH